MSELEHFDRELAELDKQIVRLGALCGLDPTQQTTITAILGGAVKPEDFAADQRRTFLLLKGLLSLRYYVEKHCVDEIGASQCMEVLENTQLK